MLLKSELISLRALEPEDIDLLYAWENDTALWEVSHTRTPFSKHLLKEYLKTSYLDIYTIKQLRLVIQDAENRPVGLLDLFDFEPYHQRAGVGILVHRDFFANIQEKNTKSLALFQKQGFEIIGLKKDWLKTAEGWENELTLQYIL